MTSDNPQENSNPPTEQRPTDDHLDRTDKKVSPRTTELQLPIAENKSHKSYKAKKHWLDYATFVVEILGLIGLGIYAFLTYGIWCSNKKSADAAKRAADTAHDTLVRTQRPWVGMKGYYLPLKLTPNIAMTAEYSQINSGHGPALAVGNRVGFGLIKEKLTKERAESELAKATPPNRYTLLPGAEFRVGYASVTINSGWLSQINGGKVWLYYFGDMTYLDEFNCSHTTRFCAVWDPKSEVFNHCDIFNDAN